MSIDGSAGGGAEGTPSGFVTASLEAPNTASGRDTQVLDMQVEHFELFRTIVEATNTETKRAVLLALHDGINSATYEEIEQYTSVSRRTLRKHVSDLVESNVVERTEGYSVSVGFATDTAQILTAHTLRGYFHNEGNI